MDFQQIANAFYSSICIMSVKRTGDNGYSDICIAAVNDKCAEYLSSQRGAGSGAVDLTIAPGTPYYEYFPQNRNFEDAVYRAAILKHEVHTYAYLNNLDVWSVGCHPHRSGRKERCAFSSPPGQGAFGIYMGHEL
ncbi:MAG: hypothetical protein K6F54_06255 [Lachnospiraceae bacterium]|nr:hypothetical protein [Lachnospiraceae bacterium]